MRKKRKERREEKDEGEEEHVLTSLVYASSVLLSISLLSTILGCAVLIAGDGSIYICVSTYISIQREVERGNIWMRSVMDVSHGVLRFRRLLSWEPSRIRARKLRSRTHLLSDFVYGETQRERMFPRVSCVSTLVEEMS